MSETMSLQPIFLNLHDRPCLLVGAGNVALEKIGSLLKTGLRLRVVAPEARPEIQELALAGRIEWIQRRFEPADLDGHLLAIAATDAPEVNQAVHLEAVRRNILSNSVDDIPNCDFFFGSVVNRGSLQIAISTAGESPALAQRLRREIDAQLPADLGSWVESLGQLRRQVLATHPAGEERKALLHQLAHRPLCESDSCPSRQMARTRDQGAGGRDQGSGGRDQGAGVRGQGSGGREQGAGVGRPVAAAVSWIANPGLRRQAGAPPAGEPGKVYLVGAGPGDPDLLTVKALRLIRSAEVVLHDDLVPQPILDLASPGAEVVNVGKRCGAKTITQEQIHSLMIAHARLNRSVVRLKSGDPLVFGRAAEEMAALAEAEVGFEVVPGITAAFAAAAAAGCSLTSRDGASSIVFSTGHHAQSHRDAALPQMEDATRVVYMPGRDLTLLAEEWLQQGLPPDFPCAIVSRAAQPGQQVRCTTLAALPQAEPVAAPSLLIAGWALRESAIPEDRVAIGEPVTA